MAEAFQASGARAKRSGPPEPPQSSVELAPDFPSGGESVARGGATDHLRRSIVFRSDGELIPAGEYLVDEWSTGATLAWREDSSRVWTPGIDEIPPSHPRIARFTDTIGRGLR